MKLMDKKKFIILILAITTCIVVVNLYFIDRYQLPRVKNLPILAATRNVVIPSFEAFWQNRSNQPWYNSLKFICKNDECQSTYDDDRRINQNWLPGYNMWRILAIGSVGTMAKLDNLSNHEYEYLLEKEANNYIKNIDNITESRYAYGLHIANLDYLQKRFPNIKALSSLIAIGGAELLFRAEKELHQRFDNMPIMMLGMSSQSLIRLSRLLHNGFPIEDLSESEQYIEYERETMLTPQGRLELADRAISAARNILKIAYQKINDQISEDGLIRDSSICWYGLADYELQIAEHDRDNKFIINSRLVEILNNISEPSILFAKLPLYSASACLDLMLQACSRFEDKKISLCVSTKNYIESTVKYHWDNPDNPICNGDGLFVSHSGYPGEIGHDRAICSSNTKDIDAIAHILNLVSRSQEFFH